MIGVIVTFSYGSNDFDEAGILRRRRARSSTTSSSIV
jgi:hypothetical protein